MTQTIRLCLRLTAFILAVLGGLAPTYGAQTKSEHPVETQMRAIAENLRCPVCQGQNVYDSNSDLALQMKQTIREKLSAGETPPQIIGFFTERYGNYVLMAPPQRGMHWGLWIGPFVLVLIGGAAIAWRVARSRQQIITGSQGNTYQDVERLEL